MAPHCTALNQPGICTVHPIEQHEGQPFIVMELLKGQATAKRIGCQSLDLPESRGPGIQIADALYALSKAWRVGYRETH